MAVVWENGGRNLRFWFRDPQKALPCAEPRRLTYFASKSVHAHLYCCRLSKNQKNSRVTLGARNHACAEPKPLNRSVVTYANFGDHRLRGFG